MRYVYTLDFPAVKLKGHVRKHLENLVPLHYNDIHSAYCFEQKKQKLWKLLTPSIRHEII